MSQNFHLHLSPNHRNLQCLWDRRGFRYYLKRVQFTINIFTKRTTQGIEFCPVVSVHPCE